MFYYFILRDGVSQEEYRFMYGNKLAKNRKSDLRVSYASSQSQLNPI